MKNKNILRLVIAFVLFPIMVNAQTSSTVYFDPYNPRQHWENPACQPEGKFYIGMPALSTIAFSAGNNQFAFNDFFRNITKDGVTRTVPTISRDLDLTEDFLKKFKFNERINANYRINLIDFGFRLKEEHYITVGVANRMQTNVIIPKKLANLFLSGMADHNVFDFDIDKLSANVNVYSEIALGYSKNLTDKINVGGKVKVLLGHGSIHTDLKKLKLTAGEDEWAIRGDGSIYASIPGLEITPTEENTIDGIKFNDDQEIKEIVKPHGGGAAVDLGVTYQMTPELTFSGSILDLGFIRWNSNTQLRKKQDFAFQGVKYEIGNDSINFFDELGEELSEMYEVVEKTNSYTTHLALKINLGAEYAFWENRVGVGLLSRTSFISRTVMEEIFISANFRPFRWVSTSLAYNIGNGQWNNLNAALDFNLGPVNLYFAMDNIPFRLGKINDAVFPIKTRSISFSTGMAFVMGYKEKKESH